MTRVRKGNTAGASKDRGAGRSIDETARDHLRAAAGGLTRGLAAPVDDGDVRARRHPVASKLLLLCGLAFEIVVGFNAVSGDDRDRGLCPRPLSNDPRS